MRPDTPTRPACADPALSDDRIDWSQLWYPGPTRVFTPQELARGGQDRISRTAVLMVGLNVLVMVAMALRFAPAGEFARFMGLLVAHAVLLWQGTLWLWRQPTRRRLAVLSVLVLALQVGIALGLRWRVADPAARAWLQTANASASFLLLSALWALSVYRAHQVAGRLRELDERDRAVDLALQLATAQVQPHFLFNSLASLQHWVNTGDPRAAGLLAALTAYLRATLPLFERRSLGLGQELDAVRHYLAVMQARWGERLRWQVDAVPDGLAEAVRLPPGVLLTLVENAVEHGVGPQLAGGTVQVLVRTDAPDLPPGTLCVAVHDDGPGLPPDLLGTLAALDETSSAAAATTSGAGPHPGRGLGLRSIRQRLAQLHGGPARLVLENRPAGGTSARLCLPIEPQPALPPVPPAPARPGH